MFKHILVAYDGSILSQKALEMALTLAGQNEGKVTILHVIREIGMPQYLVDEYSISHINFEELARKEGERLLQEAENFCKRLNGKVPYELKLLVGDPAKTICQSAESSDVQMIVMGSRGLGTLKGFMLGSVSHKVTQLAKCPVFIVK
ncbi:universal stress protein [Microaerobacter geothermalis]|uniref:universal stress protein n=1 Tax=Microaerobacter geothermalis TaxID=674972 RepID=UPI001F22C17E|nr:universal stress protein [Microaerobacter geothermalis]MCF6094212.1 universal stress protein [Microaerobacter geothermalis]